MNESPYSIVLRTPVLLAIFSALILFEILWCKFYLKKDYGTGEAFASIGIAIGRAGAKAVMGVAMAGLYMTVYELRLFTVDMSDWKAWVGLLLGADFCYYWMHRF